MSLLLLALLAQGDLSHAWKALETRQPERAAEAFRAADARAAMAGAAAEERAGVLIEYAKAEVHWGRLEAARALLTRADELHPKSPAVRHEKAQIRLLLAAWRSPPERQGMKGCRPARLIVYPVARVQRGLPEALVAQARGRWVKDARLAPPLRPADHLHQGRWDAAELVEVLKVAAQRAARDPSVVLVGVTSDDLGLRGAPVQLHRRGRVILLSSLRFNPARKGASDAARWTKDYLGALGAALSETLCPAT